MSRHCTSRMGRRGDQEASRRRLQGKEDEVQELAEAVVQEQARN